MAEVTARERKGQRFKHSPAFCVHQLFSPVKVSLSETRFA